MKAMEKKEKMEREKAKNEKQNVKEALMIEVEKSCKGRSCRKIDRGKKKITNIILIEIDHTAWD